MQKEAPAKTGFVRAKMRDTVRRMRRPKSAMMFVAQHGLGFIPVPGLGDGFSAMSSLVGDPDFSARATALLLSSLSWIFLNASLFLKLVKVPGMIKKLASRIHVDTPARKL